MKVKALGLCVLNFNEYLQDGDMLDIRYEEEKSRAWYRIEFPKKQANSHDTSLVTKNSSQVKIILT